MKNSFTELIDERNINAIVTRICVWVTFVFVVFFVSTLLFTRMYNINKANTVIVWSCIGIICFISPYILREIEVKPAIIKYYTIIILYVYICIVCSFKEPNPALSYLLPAVLSCLYYKKKVTLFAVAAGLVCHMYSKYSFSKVLHKLAYVAGDFKLGMASSVIQFLILGILLILLTGITESLIKSIKSDACEDNPFQETEGNTDRFFKKLAETFVTTRPFNKYMIITLCAMYVGLLHANPPINADIIYLFPLVFSCLYFDKRLTIYSFALSSINIIISDYFYLMFRGLNTINYYYPHILTYLLEFWAISVPIIYLASRNNALVKDLVLKKVKCLKR